MYEIAGVPWLIYLEVTASLTSIAGAIYWAYTKFFYKDTKQYDEKYIASIKDVLKENSSEALVYISYYRYSDKRPPINYTDRLYDESTTQFLFAVTAEEREKLYDKFIRTLFGLVKYIDKRLKIVKQGKLIRNIFDVEHGGFLYHKIGEDEYLFGVCLNQSIIMEAEKDMQKLVSAILVYHGLEKKKKSTLKETGIVKTNDND